jgi:AraC-like DNA-binding protein
MARKSRFELKLLELESLAGDSSFCARKLAKACGLSLRQLQRQFHRILNQTPKKWLTRQRILLSCERLSGDEAIKEVAIDLGFKQASHFSREFKRIIGSTPSQFVEKHRFGGHDMNNVAFR